MKHLKIILFIFILAPTIWAGFPAPKGLMLNLDLENVKNGLIPNKTLYPLYVPLGDLSIDRFNYRNLLAFTSDQGLDIPHSSFLDPNGDQWIVSVRAFIQEDGLIISQSNDDFGFAIYAIEHTIQAVLRSGNSSITLKENPSHGITKYRNRWVTIELQIKPNRTILSLNRRRVAMVNEKALTGDHMYIRLGSHIRKPAILKNKIDITRAGFTGAINSLKIIRQ